MNGWMTWLLATAVSLAPTIGLDMPSRFDVDCGSGRDLQDVLDRVAGLGDVDIYLQGVCRGYFVIASDGVTLRAAAPGSGIAVPEGDPGFAPLLEILDSRAALRGLVVQGGDAGIVVEGWNAEVLLFDVDVHGQTGVGVLATRGAVVRVIESTVRDGVNGIAAVSDGTLNLQHVLVTNLSRAGVGVWEESFAAINDTTIENSGDTGLFAGDRSDVNVNDCIFRENGALHIGADDWSSVSFIPGSTTIGSEADSTTFSLGVSGGATIATFSIPVFHGSVVGLSDGVIRLGNTVVHGDLSVSEFARAFVRSSEITGSVLCRDGAEAICRQTTTAGAFGCPSPTCGEKPTQALGPAPSFLELPIIEAPRLRDSSRARRPRQR